MAMNLPKVNILYEDNHMLVVEKPVNIPSQADDTGDMDLLTLLKDDIKVRFIKPGNVYLGLVHRLDRPVGGAMVFAKTSKAASRLGEQMHSGDFKKSYLAVVHGIPPSSQKLEHYLVKNTRTNTVKAVQPSTEGAKKAVLEYRVEAVIDKSNHTEKENHAGTDSKNKNKSLSLIRIRLHTGRSHQIRVQLSAIGHPLYGDQKYGTEVNKPGQQLALWSTEIKLLHPVKKEEMTFTSLPPDKFPWDMFFKKT